MVLFFHRFEKLRHDFVLLNAQEWEFVVKPDIPLSDAVPVCEISFKDAAEEVRRRDEGLMVVYAKYPDGQMCKEYPGQAGFAGCGSRQPPRQGGNYQRNGAIGRHATPLHTFLGHDMAIKAKLTRPEVIGLRLYTGPSYMPINSALRSQRFRKGKLSCSKCRKGNYTIVNGKAACSDRKCKRSCSKCNADFTGWTCRVAEVDDCKKIEYQYCTPPGLRWLEITMQEANSVYTEFQDEKLVGALQGKLDPQSRSQAIAFMEDEIPQRIFEGLTYLSYVSVQLAPGREWIADEGQQESPAGQEVSNAKLARALEEAIDFSQEQLDAFELKPALSWDSYVLVQDSGGTTTCYRPVRRDTRFFKPDESAKISKTFSCLCDVQAARVAAGQKLLFEDRGRDKGLVDAAFDFSQNYYCSCCAPGVDCFTTCVAVINSAVYKLAQCTELAPGRLLYRGLNGMSFPSDLLDIQVDPKGFVEFGFSSATPNREVAEDYSGGVCKCRDEAEAAREAGEEYHGAWVFATETSDAYCSYHRATILEIHTGAQRAQKVEGKRGWEMMRDVSLVLNFIGPFLHHFQGLSA